MDYGVLHQVQGSEITFLASRQIPPPNSIPVVEGLIPFSRQSGSSGKYYFVLKYFSFYTYIFFLRLKLFEEFFFAKIVFNEFFLAKFF